MIKLAIVGYGNLGRGVESAARQNQDMELVGIFTRRAPEQVQVCSGVPVRPLASIGDYAGKVDVLILCGGSATDLPEMTPALAASFNVVDSFDNHSRIPEHIQNVEKAAKASGHTALVSCGWDPGLFSLARVYAQAALPVGQTYTFWGPGISQGHSDAIRRIDGVLDARQYTLPVEQAVEQVRRGENPELTTRQKHTRLCYVVAKPGADLSAIEQQIKEMPAYFADYDTQVNFISQEELNENHLKMRHGGSVIRAGKTHQGDSHTVEFSLKLESNPQFTASILVACARAVVRMHRRSEAGCFTLPEVRPCDLMAEDLQTIRSHFI